MFQTINSKLTNKEFISTTLKQLAEQKRIACGGKGALKNIGDKSQPQFDGDDCKGTNIEATGSDGQEDADLKERAGMTDEEAACYAKRYSDLGKMNAREHYVKVGIDQGRIKTCARELTEYETMTYIRRNPTV